MNREVSFIPIGGIGDVTRNMYLYEYKDEILIVDCGLGFADETMLGVDLLLPDVSYLLSTTKKIAGMVLTHGHEDHIGALPFILPQLMSKKTFPVFGTPFTAELSNEKLKEFDLPYRVQTVRFTEPEKSLGSFKVSFIRVTHSVPDTSNILIKTPVGNFYHGSDYKFDFTPEDGKRAELLKIAKAGEGGITCLMSDSLHAEKEGYTPSERSLYKSLEEEMKNCKGKFLLTTYSSNISRVNQTIKIAQSLGRRICFVGRSVVKAKEVAEKLGYIRMQKGVEIGLNEIKKTNDNKLVLVVAGSQGQENSAMTRIAAGEHREISLKSEDVVVFSAESIPGNEVSVNSLIDTISKRGAKVVYSENSPNIHVSGHGSSMDIMLMISLVKPTKIVPIGGTYSQMVAFKSVCQNLGYQNKDVFLLENGQEILLSLNSARVGRKIPIKNVFVDQVTGGEIENFVLRDRQKLSESGIVALVAEIDAQTSQIVNILDITTRGFPLGEAENLKKKILKELQEVFKNKYGRVTNWVYVRKTVGEVTERLIFKEFRVRPLVLPVVIEV